jgi:hypothetical protein
MRNIFHFLDFDIDLIELAFVRPLFYIVCCYSIGMFGNNVKIYLRY